MSAHPFDFGTKGRATLPDWPRLMAVELAAAYLGIGRSTLEERGPKAKAVGRRRLYDRHDLDRWADVLDGQPLTDTQAEMESHEVERRWRDRRNPSKGE